jgi:hypothetical protein
MMDFESIHNHQERAVFERVLAMAPSYPAMAADAELLADVACIALNSLRPRYVRHDIDMHFFTSNEERARNDASVHAAVEAAFARLARTTHSNA